MVFAENKVALVTGGASGIGLAIVKKLLESNVKGVGIVDFSEVNWNNAKSSLSQKYGNKIYFVKADVSNKEELKNAFEKIVEKFKNLDIVVNNAGILDEDNWQKMVAINLNGVIQGTYFALNEYLPKYRSAEETVIINTASILGINTVPSLSVYSATKHGVIGFAKSISTQEIFKKSNIRLITICPGWIESNILHKQEKDVLDIVAKELYAICEKVVPAEYIGESVLKIIDTAKHGSVWVLEDGKTPYEVVFPNRKDMCSK